MTIIVFIEFKKLLIQFIKIYDLEDLKGIMIA